MALKLTKDFKGVLFAPRKNEIKSGSGVLYPRVVELCHAGEKNGTLLAGNSIPMQAFEKDNPPDFVGTELQMYISRDQGKTWEYRSSIAYIFR